MAFQNQIFLTARSIQGAFRWVSFILADLTYSVPEPAGKGALTLACTEAEEVKQWQWSASYILLIFLATFNAAQVVIVLKVFEMQRETLDGTHIKKIIYLVKMAPW